MRDLLRGSAGKVFKPAEAYVADVGRLWSSIDRFDKLERIQHFRQPEDASWRAFAAGHWQEALEFSERNRPEVVAEFAEDARLGYRSYRVRVVGLPIDPDVQWEMHRFKIRGECGENIRIIGPELVARFEQRDPVPELIFMGSLAMYEVLYDEDGILAGGRKFTDPELVATCRAEAQDLYAQGEDFRSFFEREIAHLPPPAGDREVSRSTRP